MIEVKSIKADMHAFLYGVEKRASAAVLASVKRKLARMERMMEERLFYGTPEVPAHDGPTLDLLPTEYRVLRERYETVRDRY